MSRGLPSKSWLAGSKSMPCFSMLARYLASSHSNGMLEVNYVHNDIQSYIHKQCLNLGGGIWSEGWSTDAMGTGGEVPVADDEASPAADDEHVWEHSAAKGAGGVLPGTRQRSGAIIGTYIVIRFHISS